MPRPEKVQAVADIKSWWENAEAVFITEYRGLTVGQMATLRRLRAGMRKVSARGRDRRRGAFHADGDRRRL